MIRFVTAIAAAAAFAAPALAQSSAMDPSSMTCADYMALDTGDRSNVLQGLAGTTGSNLAEGMNRGQGGASSSTSSSNQTASAAGPNATDAASARADVSSEQIIAICEGNEDMAFTDAVQQAEQDGQ